VSDSLVRPLLTLAVTAALSAGCARRAVAPVEPPLAPSAAGGALTPPAPLRELRGVWIATVSNIDWPSIPSRGDSARQQADLRVLLDRATTDGFNAVILQVRSGGDALYRSTLEPWAALLGNGQGVDPGWDPLAFAIAEAHARGLELHAWFNPYRAGSARDSLAFASNHVFRTRRDLVRNYAAALWMDPGDPDVSARTLAAITDVVKRYDVDGVHIDDFFYPYPVADSSGRLVDFPDSATYARFNPRALSRGDWRRDNVNRFVERMYDDVHRAKPWVRVGISPFGIWRPGNPAQIKGLDAYDAIYADSKLWLGRGWLDYFVPQLYWGIEPPAQSFTALLDWWVDPAQNPRSRPVWPGLASYRVDTTAYHPGTLPPPADTVTFRYQPGEILRQIRETRRREPLGATGVVLYNGSSVLTRVGGILGAMLRDSAFQEGALTPAMPWLGARAPARPRAGAIDSAAVPGAQWSVSVRSPSGEPVRWWAVRWRVGGQWTPLERFPAQARRLAGDGAAHGRPEAVAIWAVSRSGVLSAPTVVALPR
jgi:uncharacterized lipoprotein YddW (UPF0748 family)